MDRRRRLRVNAYEMLTADVLQSATQPWNADVAEKVRVADAIDISQSGLTEDEYSYALSAHFDFVVVEGDDHRTLFAVEFDGPGHDTDADARRRDLLKQTICERLGMPLLRIREEHLIDVKHESILAWLVTCWFLASLLEPVTGEGFSYRLTAVEERDGRRRLVTFVPEARGRIFDFLVRDAGGGEVVARGDDRSEQRNVTMWFPHTVAHDDPDGIGEAQAYAFVRLRNQYGLIGRARCRAVHFGPIRARDIAAELALLDATEKIDSLNLGQASAAELLASPDEFDGLIAATQAWESQPLFVPELPI